MNKIQILDCTLRDGGYCNQWNFGYDNICKITQKLSQAGIDVIECGFLTNKIVYNRDVTKYSTIEEFTGIIPKGSDKSFVAMVNFGEYDIDTLPFYDGKSIDGLRLAFHKKDRYEALKQCKKIKQKGYKVYVQPMVSLNYTDEEFIEMLKIINTISPFAFYIVDSFGMMKNKDLIRLFYLVEHNLDSRILIGFHSHNNMQLAFSNAQALSEINTSRSLIIDSSIFGMGRGAGNLNTEIFIEYLNETIGSSYKLNLVLSLIDDVIGGFYQTNSWGYSLPNYLSASYNVHPNYASFLDDKKTLTVEEMSEIFKMIEPNKKVEFDKEYIEELYIKRMNAGGLINSYNKELISALKGKKILLIAPGKSIVDESKKILNFIDSKTITISINFDYSEYKTDFIFLSNLRRFREFNKIKNCKCIVTSNIPVDDVYCKVDYVELRNSIEYVEDNAGLMCIKMLINMGFDEIYLAGFDGYSINHSDNYAKPDMIQFTNRNVLNQMNYGMNKVIDQYSKKVKITSVTEPKYIDLKYLT